jgi:putative transposase
MRAILRRARYGYLLAFHILLLCAVGRNPTEIAACLFCSRSSVYRIVRAYRAGSLGVQIDEDGQLSIAVQTSVLMPWLTRSLGALLKKAPRAYGWCRTRWSCATLAMTLQTKHGIAVSAETVRRWLHEIGWVWKRAKLVAKDDDPHRTERLALIRFHHETLQAHEVMVFADALDIHLLPKVGAAWMPQGTQAEVMTPGQNEKHYLAGALHLATGKVLYCLGPRKNNGLFRTLLTLLDTTYPGNRSGCDNVALAIISPHGVPWRHGHTAGLITRGVGTDSVRSASLYSGPRSACGDFRRHDAGVARPAEPDLAELLTPTIQRPAPQRAATPSSEYTPSWWSTGPSRSYPHPCACGRS